MLSGDECSIDFVRSLNLGIGDKSEILKDDDINEIKDDWLVVRECWGSKENGRW